MRSCSQIFKWRKITRNLLTFCPFPPYQWVITCFSTQKYMFRVLNVFVFRRMISNKSTTGSIKENMCTAYTCILLLEYKRQCLISSLVVFCLFVCFLRIYFALGLSKGNHASLKKIPYCYFIEMANNYDSSEIIAA